MKLLTSRDYTKTVKQIMAVVEQLEPMDQGEELVEQELSDQEVENLSKKQKNHLHTLSSAGRSQTLGADPKKARKEMRDRMEPGFHLSETIRNGTLILHKHGSCFAIPGLDYLKYRYARPPVPQRSEYHQVCRLCARGGIVNEVAGDSSDTQTSSSSDE